MLDGSIVNVVFSLSVVILILSGIHWAQPKTSTVAFFALIYAWYATTTIWAANTKKLERELLAAHEHLFPSTSFWLTFLPQVLSCLCICALSVLKRTTMKATKSDPSGTSLNMVAWIVAGSAFFFGQLFTVGGLGAGAPALVFGIKVLEPLTTSLLAIPVLGQRCNWRLLAAIVVSCAGIALTVFGSLRSAHKAESSGRVDDLGVARVIIGAALANLGYSSRACVIKKAYSQKKLPPLETFIRLNMTAACCGVLTLIIWLPFYPLYKDGHIRLMILSNVLSARPWAWFSTCLCYFLYQSCSLLLLDCLLVESHALLVAMKHIFVVILASVLSGSALNALMIVGIVVASIGVFYYSRTNTESTQTIPLVSKVGHDDGIPRGLTAAVALLGILGTLSPLKYA